MQLQPIPHAGIHRGQPAVLPRLPQVFIKSEFVLMVSQNMKWLIIYSAFTLLFYGCTDINQ